jgi:pilus assembly protein Flp/PilA
MLASVQTAITPQSEPVSGAKVMKSLFNRFVKNESGATAIEYALIAAIIGVGIVAALGSLKGELNTTFNKASTAMKNG